MIRSKGNARRRVKSAAHARCCVINLGSRKRWRSAAMSWEKYFGMTVECSRIPRVIGNRSVLYKSKLLNYNVLHTN